MGEECAEKVKGVGGVRQVIAQHPAEPLESNEWELMKCLIIQSVPVKIYNKKVAKACFLTGN